MMVRAPPPKSRGVARVGDLILSPRGNIGVITRSYEHNYPAHAAHLIVFFENRLVRVVVMATDEVIAR